MSTDVALKPSSVSLSNPITPTEVSEMHVASSANGNSGSDISSVVSASAITCSLELSPSEVSDDSASLLLPPQAPSTKNVVTVRYSIRFIIPPLTENYHAS